MRVVTYAAALKVADRMTVAAGGFGLCGIPENLVAESPASRHNQSNRHFQQLRGG